MKTHTISAREPVLKPASQTVSGFDCTLIERVVGIDIITIPANVLLSALSSVKARASERHGLREQS